VSIQDTLTAIVELDRQLKDLVAAQRSAQEARDRDRKALLIRNAREALKNERCLQAFMIDDLFPESSGTVASDGANGSDVFLYCPAVKGLFAVVSFDAMQHRRSSYLDHDTLPSVYYREDNLVDVVDLIVRAIDHAKAKELAA
jgi:hypothetical protein